MVRPTDVTAWTDTADPSPLRYHVAFDNSGEVFPSGRDGFASLEEAERAAELIRKRLGDGLPYAAAAKLADEICRGDTTREIIRSEHAKVDRVQERRRVFWRVTIYKSGFTCTPFTTRRETRTAALQLFYRVTIARGHPDLRQLDVYRLADEAVKEYRA